MKILVKVRDERYTHIEDVTWDYNDENKEYTRELSEFEATDKNISKFNGNHFIFGYMECLAQSDYCPPWLYEAEKSWISVEHIEVT